MLSTETIAAIGLIQNAMTEISTLYWRLEAVKKELNALIPELSGDVLQRRIEDLDLDCRTYNCIKRAGVHNVGDLVRLREADLKKIQNMGKVSIRHVKESLTDLNLSLRSEL